jgi:hypothetical protein
MLVSLLFSPCIFLSFEFRHCTSYRISPTPSWFFPLQVRFGRQCPTNPTVIASLSQAKPTQTDISNPSNIFRFPFTVEYRVALVAITVSALFCIFPFLSIIISSHLDEEKHCDGVLWQFSLFFLLVFWKLCTLPLVFFIFFSTKLYRASYLGRQPVVG